MRIVLICDQLFLFGPDLIDPGRIIRFFDGLCYLFLLWKKSLLYNSEQVFYEN